MSDEILHGRWISAIRREWLPIVIIEAISAALAFAAPVPDNTPLHVLVKVVMGLILGILPSLLWVFAGAVLRSYGDANAELRSTAEKLEKSYGDIEGSAHRLERASILQEQKDIFTNDSPFTGVLGSLYATSKHGHPIEKLSQGEYLRRYLKDAIQAAKESYKTIQHDGLRWFEKNEWFWLEFKAAPLRATRVLVMKDQQELEAEKADESLKTRYLALVGSNTDTYWITQADLESLSAERQDLQEVELDDIPAGTEPSVASLGSTDVVICDEKLFFRYNDETKTLGFWHDHSKQRVPFRWVFDCLDDHETRQRFTRVAVSSDEMWRSTTYIRHPDAKGVTIDINAVVQNLRLVTPNLIPPNRVMAILKYDAYGLGLEPVAHALVLNGIRWFGVSSVTDAIRLRTMPLPTDVSQTDISIVLLEGFTSTQAPFVPRFDLQPMVWDRQQLDILHGLESKQPIRVHIKVNTGMNCFGVSPEGLDSLLDAVVAGSYPTIMVEGISSHLQKGWQPKSASAKTQLKEFSRIVSQTKERLGAGVRAHLGNSATVIGDNCYDFDLVRIGGLLYGAAYPLPTVRRDASLEPLSMQDCIKVSGVVRQVRFVPPGEFASYSSEPRENDELHRNGAGGRIAVANLGYGDGLPSVPPSARKNWNVLVRGIRCPVVGVMRMGAAVVDVDDVDPPIRPGDEVVVVGSGGSDAIALQEVATWWNCHPYDVLCKFGKCLPRDYVGDRRGEV